MGVQIAQTIKSENKNNKTSMKRETINHSLPPKEFIPSNMNKGSPHSRADLNLA